MICIVGEQGSGKSTLANELEKFGYEKVVTYTSRPPREGEVDGEDYHFKSREFFESKRDQFLEISEYRGWLYGCMTKDFHQNSVVVLTPAGMRRLIDYEYEASFNEPLDVYTVYLMVSRRQRLIKLLSTREDIDEILRRDMTEIGQFDGIVNEVDCTYMNDNYMLPPTEMAKLIKGDFDNAKTKEK